MPESGGEYMFLARTVHPLAGFLAGWVSLLAGFSAPIAAAALGLQAYVDAAVKIGGRPEWIGTGAILIAGLLHGFRLRAGVGVQNVAVLVKMLAIGAFVAVGVVVIPARGEVPIGSIGPVDVSAFAVTLVWIAFSYSGWNAAVYVAGEVRDTDRSLARALVIATGIVTVAYLLLNAVFLYAVPTAALVGKPEVGAIAAEALGGPWLRNAVCLLVALALFTSISSMVMIGPRVYARMGAVGVFGALLRLGEEVPAAAIALQVVLAVLLVWVSRLAELLGYMGFTLGLSAAATVGALLAVRRREGAARVPIPGHPWVPLLFIVFTVGAAGFMALRRPFEAGVGLATMATGIPAYFVLRAASRSRP
jgi:APA family basic amino acid/polyamine antiporter